MKDNSGPVINTNIGEDVKNIPVPCKFGEKAPCNGKRAIP